MFSTKRPAPDPFFGIHVIDAATGRGVPLVELETVHNLLFVTDSNGWAAVSEPGLMGREVFFSVRSHGYTFPKDGFGYAGMRLKLVPGGRTEIKVQRSNIAERICRLTGEGIYRDSALLGEQSPLREPLLAGGVIGQDSAQAAVLNGKMLWFWGDTSRLSYPLGNFHTTGAVAAFPQGETTAARGLDFDYFVNADGFAREMCRTTKPGPIWITGLVVLPDQGEQTLFAHYTRVKDLGTRYEHGYIRWDERENVFRFVRELPLKDEWRFLDGHPIRLEENGAAFLAGGFAFPTIRVAANVPHLLNPAAYEAFTCLGPDGKVRRDRTGRVIYHWQRQAPPITPVKEAELIKKGELRSGEARFLPIDRSGKQIVTHGGSVTWNPWRRRWIMIMTQSLAKESALGEIFYGEAEHPMGPWRRAVKIVTHDRYTFYNPVHHPFLDTDGGRVIYFEGTYTRTFSNAPSATPRYDYNQILYRLDLADPRLNVARSG